MRCKLDDERAARDLYDLGVVPGGDIEKPEICLEADGTWVRLQGVAEGEPKRVEIKALTSYSGKIEQGRKTVRTHVVAPRMCR